MHFTVSTFYAVKDGGRRPWKAPLAIPASEFPGYRAAARDLVKGLLAVGHPNAVTIGLEITDPTGKLVFDYVMRVPSGV